jgi:rRNA maturation endonuclease Nob1
MFGLFKKNIDDLSLLIYTYSSILEEFIEYRLRKRSFDRFRIQEVIKALAKQDGFKLSDQNIIDIRLAANLIALHVIESDDEILELLNEMELNINSNTSNRDPLKKLSKYLTNYGVSFCFNITYSDVLNGSK